MDEVAVATAGSKVTTTEPEKSLGKRLQKARQDAGLTQQELCQRASLSYSTLAKIERGAIKSPSVFTIQQIAGVLNSSLDALVGQRSIISPPADKRVSKSGIRFVYFDINGCLVRFFHRAFTKLAEDTGARPDIIETTFWHYNDQVCRGEMPMSQFNRLLAEELSIESLDWQSYYMAAVDPIQETRDLLAWAAEHYYIGLLSNIMPGLIEAMMKNGKLPPVHYSAIVDSSVVHAIKPEPEMYEIAEQQAGCRPQEILFVDDSRSNLMAAEKRGWHVLWFDDFHPAESAARVKKSLEFDA